jgi:short-subunit dehydrogenase
VADFSDSELKNYERIQSQIQHLNISILINNVGMAETGNFNELSPKILRNMILVNMLSQSLMTRMVIPGMLTRHSHNQHSLVIDLSSIAGTRPFPYLSMYAATKNFNSFLG